MDPATFAQRTLNCYILGYYLGIDESGTEESRTHSNAQGMRLLKHYNVIPERDTPANCPTCRERLRTGTDTERYGWRYICNNHGQRLRISPTDNTFLSKARLKGGMTADKIVRVIHKWLRREPLINAQVDLSISPETAVAWYGYCRDVACAIAWHDFVSIGGSQDVIEVDVRRLFKGKHNVGKSTKWQYIWVLSGISRSTKKRFGIIVKKIDADTLLPIMQQCIDGDSYVCTDCWISYKDCNMIFNGHGTVNHAENFVNPPKQEPPIWMPAGRFSNECLDWNWNQNPPAPGLQPFRNHTQTIERAWRDLKSHLKSTNNVESGSQYIGEWMYRRNILGEIITEKGQFEKFLGDIRRVYPGVGKITMKLRYEDILNCDCHECEP